MVAMIAVEVISRMLGTGLVSSATEYKYWRFRNFRSTGLGVAGCGLRVAGNSWNQLLNLNPYALNPFY